ncbi:hypothetical protein ABTI04_19185, partial [Acinetobacter baumannii]
SRLKALSIELGAAAPPALAELSNEELARFADSLRMAQRAQKEQIRRAFDSALSHVPFLLRGPLKKLLGG